MRVDPTDGKCRECGGELEIVDADDVSLTVSCLDCCEEFRLETDGLNDGGIHYYPLFLAQQFERGASEDPE